MITIYSKAGCGYCTAAKSLLESWDIQFEEVRIDQDNDARNFVLEEGHKTVPQLYVGTSLLVEGGFDGLTANGKIIINEKVEEYENRSR